MAFFTASQFESFTQTKLGNKSFAGILNEARLFSKANAETSVFLSHSHMDKAIVGQTVTFLRTLNINAYVDWMDETMSEKPDGLTGERIKSKILSNDKFILLATDTAIVSKWCNWEVGIGDAYKLQSDKICLLPLADNRGHWTGSEYLQIYPRIEPVQNLPNIFRLIYPDNKQAWFDEWLKK
jgi:hypothetical protein